MPKLLPLLLDRPHSPRRYAGTKTDQRGSAIVLVLVSCVLMAVLAATLLQLARFERIPQSQSNIDVVVESVVEEIVNQLTDDILDDAGNVFNPTLGAGGGDEPWDFPWTTPSIAPGRTVESSAGATVNVFGGAFDDTWLASTAPDYRAANRVPANTVNFAGVTKIANTNGVWRKISSLSGMFLSNGSGGSDLSATDTPTENFVNNVASELTRDTNILVSSNALVDADRDGIGDSRWEWAPLKQIGATQYVTAVRIIDLSARADLNVPLGRFNTTLATLPRGDSPAELDIEQLIDDVATRSGINTGTAETEWRAVISSRLSGGATTTPIASVATNYDGNTAIPASQSRRDVWVNGSSLVDNDFNFNGKDPDGGGPLDYGQSAYFYSTDAFELLYRNGLSNATTSSIENLMPAWLRQNAGNESDFSDAFANQARFFLSNPRSSVSPFTGSSVTAPSLPGNTTHALKLDINEAVKTDAGRTELRNEIDRVISSGNTAALLALFPQFNTSADQLADQLAANITDYIDSDNKLTRVGTRYGFEALPYIGEVYTQQVYGIASKNEDGTNDVILNWESEGETGVVIEIANPFARYNGTAWTGRPVKLTDVWLRINGADDVELSALSGRTELLPGDVLLITRNSTGCDTATLDTLDFVANPTFNTQGNFNNVYTAALTTALPSNVSLLTFTLHAELDDAAATLIKYTGCEAQVSADTIAETLSGITTTTLDVDDQGFVRTHYRGFAQGLQMMTVDQRPDTTVAGGVANGYTVEVSSLDTPSVNTDTTSGQATLLVPAATTLGNETKASSPAIFTSLAGEQFNWPDSTRERMQWVGDILQIPMVGMGSTATGDDAQISKAFVDTTGGATAVTGGIDALYLPYKVDDNLVTDAPIINNTAAPYNVPHSLMLLERLTTFNPATDTEDGDGDSDSATESFASPDYDEMLVPGKLNLNTATLETIRSLLPLPTDTSNTDLLRRRVSERIIERRESLRQLTDYGMGLDNIPGLVSPAAFYEHIGRSMNQSPIGSANTGDTFDLGTPAVRVDLNDYESPLGTYPANTDGASGDGVGDDREEELMIAKWLSEVASARSDVFAAYIVVQGYPADAFTGGVTESAELIVIFSRANVGPTDERAQEIARLRVK